MLWCLVFLLSSVGATIVPEEIPSLLSIVYSNIPPIKKGTDSRVGFGFALGPHADFQVLFELGPQKETQQSPMQFPHQINNKRKVAGRQTQKAQTKRKASPSNDSNTNATEYLSGWSERFKQKKPSSKPFQPLQIPNYEDKDSTPAGTIDLKKIIQIMGMTDGQINQPQPSISSNALNKLKELYGQKVASEKNTDSNTLTTSSRPRFVLKKNKSKSTTRLPSSFDRLTQFAINEQKNNAVKKRKVTEDLSDVSLDDE